MKSAADSPQEYIDSLPEERRDLIRSVRDIILKHLPKGYQESINWGMLSYEVPLDVCPDTYNGQPLQYAALASQKNYCSLYILGVYCNEECRKWFEDEWKKTGKKLNMGKCCIRFKSLDDLPLELIGKAVAKMEVGEFVENYKKMRG